LQTTDAQIHWFSIINSVMIVLFLTGMVAMIMMRTLHADFLRYNSSDKMEEAEETGWKLVHGDVFRPPNFPMLLSVFVGTGLQVFGMTVVVMGKLGQKNFPDIYLSFCSFGLLVASKQRRPGNCHGSSLCCNGVGSSADK
jgi:hypothetical protein